MQIIIDGPAKYAVNQPGGVKTSYTVPEGEQVTLTCIPATKPEDIQISDTSGEECDS